MNLLAIPTGPFEEICYLIWGKTNEALVFDPGADADVILVALKERGLTVAAYVCTHGHADHICALNELHQKNPAPVIMHSKDQKWAFSSMNQIAPYYAVPGQPADEYFQSLESTEEWNLGDLHFLCIETPGHTPGSCCLFFPEHQTLISGDTLFKDSCGRTDLPGGDSRALKTSLEKLKQLPPETRVYPGHGPDTTIGRECAVNFFMQ